MIVAIIGSRKITSMGVVNATIRAGMKSLGIRGSDITSIISGGAKGVDTIVKDIALVCNIPFKEYQADWNKYGRRAGFVRNTEMADVADVVIAVWDGESKGTQHMIKESMNKGKLVYWNEGGI